MKVCDAVSTDGWACSLPEGHAQRLHRDSAKGFFVSAKVASALRAAHAPKTDPLLLRF